MEPPEPRIGWSTCIAAAPSLGVTAPAQARLQPGTRQESNCADAVRVGDAQRESAHLAARCPHCGRPGSMPQCPGPVAEMAARCRGVNDVDITARLRLSQRMEAVGQLAGGVAHDFNNLLTPLMAYSEMLVRELPEGSRAHTHAAEIARMGERAAELIRHLLAFARGQAMEPRRLSVNDVVTDIETLLRRVIGEDTSLAVTLEPHLGQVVADPSQLGQVILNLAVNARDAMPDGGTLTIETRNVALTSEHQSLFGSVAPGRYVEMTVTDTGCGMDRETQARVFEPFFTTKGEGRGTGLGLASAYGIIHQSGGYISVYSEVGLGSTFRVLLPRADGTAADPSASHGRSAAVPGGDESILLVEDDERVRVAVAAILKSQGYAVTEAETPLQAIRACDDPALPVDLLLTDVVMPQMSGPNLAAGLKAARSRMKVLFMSGYAEVGMVDRGTLDAGSEFIQKPFLPAQLARKLRGLLDSRE